MIDPKIALLGLSWIFFFVVLLHVTRQRPRRKTRMIVVDTETGGLDANQHALLSIAAVDSLTGDRFFSLVRAAEGTQIDARALAVNGFSEEECRSEDRPAEECVMTSFANWLAKHKPALIAGCNVKFDVAFLNAAFERADLPSPLGHRHFDLQTLALAAHELNLIRLELKDGVPSASLDGVLKALGMARSGCTHGADEDAELTLKAIQALLDRLA